MIEFLISHIGVSISFLLCLYMGIVLLAKGKKYKLLGISMLVTTLGFLLSSVLIYYKFYTSYFWIIPEFLFLSGVIGFSYTLIIGGKKDNGKI